MNLTHQLSNIFLFLYKNLNRTGILNRDWAQSLFVSSYFAYKKHLEDPMAKLIKNYPQLFADGHILDIGANIGYTTYIFSKVLTTSYNIFAFEPEKRNVYFLNKNAKKYHFSNNLVITAAAVGDKEGEIELWQNDSHHADHRVLTDEFRKKLQGTISTQKIPLITIDQFLQEHQATQAVAFIKIDVQGYELAVCHGMEKTLKANPDCVIAFEYCPSIIKALGYSPTRLLAFFQEKNYYFFLLDKKGRLKALDLNQDEDLSLINHPKGYVDIVCSLKNVIQP